MKLFTTTALLSLAATPLIAGGLNTAQPDPVLSAPAPAPVASFAGTDWTGGYIGAQLGYGDLDADGAGIADSSDGVIGGLNGGYLYDFGSFVMGGEVAVNATDLDFDGGNGSLDSLSQLKLKAGYDLGRTLVYGTLGAAYGDGDIQGLSASDFGYTVGAGVDYLVTDSVSVGGEITYNMFDDFDGSGVDLDTTTVTANVAYRF